MARLQTLELPEGAEDNRPPFILDEDLPEPWRVVPSPIDQERAATLDEAADLQAGIRHPSSWNLIENADTGRRLMLRMGASEAGVEITGMYVPGPNAIGIGEVRKFPLAAIETAVRTRSARAATVVEAALAAGSDADEGPLGRPDGPDDTRFYGRLALRYLRVAGRSHRPATDLARKEGVTPRTVQRWISRARELGLLLPGRRGRAT
ncbi:helix-turn-helix domain-containing protein [Streptomyces gardneri]|uniref:helix-turn-helix domain-containing protein n=1 Tax=Streptomyces gardneri TaxID=66892 RepID=UPI0035DB44F8